MNPNNSDRTDLSRIARLARAHPTYVAHALAQYQQDEALDDAALAVYLQCEDSMLVRLALCGLPRPAPQFADDVQEIATYAGANPMRLMRLLRTVEARRALQEGIEPRQQTREHDLPFVAARDREDGDSGARKASPDTQQDD